MAIEAPIQIEEPGQTETPADRLKRLQKRIIGKKEVMAAQFPPTNFSGVDLSPRPHLTGLASTNRDLIEEYILPKLEYLAKFRRLQKAGRIREVDPETRRIVEELNDEVALVRDNRRILAEGNRGTNRHETVSPRTARQELINSPAKPNRTLSQTLEGFQIEVSGTPNRTSKQEPAGIL